MKTLKKIKSRLKRGLPVTEDEQWLYYQETGQTKGYSPPPVKANGKTEPMTKNTTYVYKECHKGNVEAIKLGNLTIYGGGTSHGVKAYKGWVVIDLNGAFRPDTYIMAEGFSASRAKLPLDEPTIGINWPDMGVPKLDVEFWEALKTDLLKLSKKETKTDVIVCCMGGHGRTGTCLSILAALLLGEKEPIKYIREKYCHKAVESEEQMNYVEKMTGLKLDDKPYKSYDTVGNYGNAGGSGVVWTYQNGSWYRNGVKDDSFGKSTTETKKEEKSSTPITHIETYDAGWEAVTCTMCYGPKIDGMCQGCNRIEALCDCPI